MKIQFANDTDLVPAVVQHAETGSVLMVGYMNREALACTESTKRVTFFSRSKNRLWVKGETSGNFLDVVSLHSDCDEDALLIRALPQGPTCHTGSASCFGDVPPSSLGVLAELERTIQGRKALPVEGSYTSKLFEDGIKRIAQKVGEEGVEVALEGVTGGGDHLVGEAADLLYHLMVLLVACDRSLGDVAERCRLRMK